MPILTLSGQGKHNVRTRSVTPDRMLLHIRYSRDQIPAPGRSRFYPYRTFGNFSRGNHGFSRNPFNYNFQSFPNLANTPKKNDENLYE